MSDSPIHYLILELLKASGNQLRAQILSQFEVRRIWSFRSRVDESNQKDQERLIDPDARPDFLCIGAQKAGTSWLYAQLTSHPDFWMPPLKEIKYFDQMSRSRHPDRLERSKLPMRDERDRRFREAMENLCTMPHLDLERYAQLFAPKASLLSGDISPGYSTVPDEIVERIVEYWPHLKIIFLARDPVERAWSDLSMKVRLGGIDSFDATNTDEVMRNLLRPDVILRSYPSKIVARWRRYVHPDLFRIYFFDDLERDPAEMRSAIICFLGGDPNKPSRGVKVNHKINEGTKKLPFSDEVRSHVVCFFEKELKTCAAELGGPAREWPVRYGL
jgi:hypothetical protein